MAQKKIQNKRTVLDFIKDDHDRMRSLIRKFRDNLDAKPEKRSALLRRIRDEVVPHARAEEDVVYNNMRKVDAPTDWVYHGFLEHAETEAQLHALEAMEAIHVEWRKLAEKFCDDLEHHIREEEEELFPQVRAAFSHAELEGMADKFRSQKPEIRERGAISNTIAMVGNLVTPSLNEVQNFVREKVTSWRH